MLAFTAGMDEAAFVSDRKTRHAVAYALLAIGEAVKQVPADVRAAAPEIDWRRIAGMRDVLAHGYFAVDAETVWSVVRDRIPVLRGHIRRLAADAPAAGE